jgi:hypothetical protein
MIQPQDVKPKAWLVPLVLFLSACTLLAQAPAKADAKQEIAALQDTQRKTLEAVAADYEKSFAALQTWYLAGLDKLMAETAKSGDLEAVLVIKNERGRVAEKKPTADEEVRTMPAALRQLRGLYAPALKRVEDDSARRKEAADRTYLTALDALQKRITMSGDFDQALLVKAERERVIAAKPPAPPAVAVAATAATPAPAPAAPATPPPASAESAAVVGSWTFTPPDGKGKQKRYLNADGYFCGTGFAGNGRWKLEKGKVTLSYPDGKAEEMAPPLDPAGTDIITKQGRKYTAVRDSEQLPLPTAFPTPSAADAASANAVKALVTGSRWYQVPVDDLKAEGKHYQEFYRDGVGANSWGRKPNWEIIPPKTLHIFDADDTRHSYYEIDVAKKVAMPDQSRGAKEGAMRFDKRVNTPPRSAK